MKSVVHSTDELIRACSYFEDEKYDYRKECEKLQRLAIECGLKEKADDIRVCLAYLRGVINGRSK